MYAFAAAFGVTAPGVLIAGIVSCGYIGAYTLHTCEKRDAWLSAMASSSFSMASVALGMSSPFSLKFSWLLTVGYT